MQLFYRTKFFMSETEEAPATTIETEEAGNNEEPVEETNHEEEKEETPAEVKLEEKCEEEEATKQEGEDKIEFPEFPEESEPKQQTDEISMDIPEEEEKKEEAFAFPTDFQEPKKDETDTNEIKIDLGEAEEKPADDSFQFNFGDATGGNDFQFSFNDFPQDGEADNGASFTFDANDQTPAVAEEDQLYEKFITLIANPCFEYTGKPLVELFKHEDPTDSAAAAFALLVGEADK